MSEHQASRTLVKSPPELWAECSDAQSLARHLGDTVGEIRIKRLEPETTVAWEGESISGTVRLEPSGWGTKVTLTAAAEAPVAAKEPELEAVAEPEQSAPEPAAPEPLAPEPLAPEPPARTGFVARFRRWFTSAPADTASAAETAPTPEPVAPPPPEPTPEPAPISEPEPAPAPISEPEPATNQVDLTAALDSLGKAHHRPFSRA